MEHIFYCGQKQRSDGEYNWIVHQRVQGSRKQSRECQGKAGFHCKVGARKRLMEKVTLEQRQREMGCPVGAGILRLRVWTKAQR